VRTAGKYVVSEASRNRSAFVIGAFTVFLVVMFITVLQAAIARSPIVFMKLAESEVGEFDLQITPSATRRSFVATNRQADLSAWLGNNTDAAQCAMMISNMSATPSFIQSSVSPEFPVESYRDCSSRALRADARRHFAALARSGACHSAR
jgi:hypothetical protein